MRYIIIALLLISCSDQFISKLEKKARVFEKGRPECTISFPKGENCNHILLCRIQGKGYLAMDDQTKYIHYYSGLIEDSVLKKYKKDFLLVYEFINNDKPESTIGSDTIIEVVPNNTN